MKKTSKWNKSKASEVETVRRTIYMVSGLQRTGTAMMMQALEAGGMDVLYDLSKDTSDGRDKLKEYEGEPYHLNPRGFYELEKKNWKYDEWTEILADKVTKNLLPSTMTLPPLLDMDYKIIMMFRDPDEIEESWVVSKIDPTEFYAAGLSMRYYDLFMADTIEFLEKERDAQVISVHFADVIANPRKELRRIKKAGWPIAVGKAAAAVDPKLHRIKVKS